MSQDDDLWDIQEDCCNIPGNTEFYATNMNNKYKFHHNARIIMVNTIFFKEFLKIPD